MILQKVTQLSHDAFARHTFMRGLVPLCYRMECNWCGKPGKYIYWNLADDDMKPHRQFKRGEDQYCSVTCFRCWVAI